MRVGVGMGAVPPFDKMTKRVARLDEAGFQSFWWPDHLAAFHSEQLWSTGGLSALQPDPHVYTDPFLCMAACAPAAGEGLVGVCVTDAIRRTAPTLVQTALTLDHLAPGRVVLGLGSGEYANYGPYGIDAGSPAARLESGAAQVRRLLDDPGPDEHGAVMGLRPPDGSSGPALWVAAHGPRGFAVAGRYADGWIPNFLTPQAWRHGSEQVVEAAEASGRDPDRLVLGLSAQVVVQPTHEQAHALLAHPVLKAFALLLPPERFAAAGAEHPLGGGGLHKMVASLDGEGQLAAAERVPFQVVHDYLLHGTPADVADSIGEYRGLDHLVLWDPVPLADLDAGRAGAPGLTELAGTLRAAV